MIIKRVSTEDEIVAIKKLQSLNLKSSLSEDEMEAQGFVTAAYSIDFLKEMHDIEPAIIAKDKEDIVGYALVATKAVMGKHHLLNDLFKNINAIEYAGVCLDKIDYVIVAQLCVDKNYRGHGLAQKLYQFFRTSLHQKYIYCLTDVDEKNARSIRAHLKTGFTVLNTFAYGDSNWHIVIWDWNK